MDSLKIIKTDEEYNEALKKLAQLMDADPKPNSYNFNHLEVLALIIEDYESKHCYIGEPSPAVSMEFVWNKQI